MPIRRVFITFNTNSINNNKIALNLNGNMINQVPSIRFLGVILDEKLNWKTHIADIVSSCNKFCGIFYKIRGKIPPKILKFFTLQQFIPKSYMELSFMPIHALLT